MGAVTQLGETGREGTGRFRLVSAATSVSDFTPMKALASTAPVLKCHR